jgi:hypothetical protein
MKKLPFVDSNISNTSPAHENKRASVIHFFKEEAKSFVWKIKKTISKGIKSGLVIYRSDSLFV